MNVFLTEKPKVVILIDPKTGTPILAKTNISTDVKVELQFSDNGWHEATKGIPFTATLC